MHLEQRDGTRLYRGLREPYRASAVPADRLHGTDFTDCPFAYAASRRGVVLVVDIPAGGGPHVSEETWPSLEARRFIVWGEFDRWLVGVIPAKELRAVVRRKGVGRLGSRDRGELLKQAITRRLAAAAAPQSD